MGPIARLPQIHAGAMCLMWAPLHVALCGPFYTLLMWVPLRVCHRSMWAQCALCGPLCTLLYVSPFAHCLCGSRCAFATDPCGRNVPYVGPFARCFMWALLHIANVGPFARLPQIHVGAMCPSNRLRELLKVGNHKKRSEECFFVLQIVILRVSQT